MLAEDPEAAARLPAAAGGRPARASGSAIPTSRGRSRPSPPPGARGSTRARWRRDRALRARARRVLRPSATSPRSTRSGASRCTRPTAASRSSRRRRRPRASPCSRCSGSSSRSTSARSSTSAPITCTCSSRPSRSPSTTATACSPIRASSTCRSSACSPTPTSTSAGGSSIPRAPRPGTACPSSGSLAGDTVYVAAVDAEGNAASLVHSLYGAFGAGVVAGRTGVVLQNRGAYFSLDPAHPNRLEPGKRPLHTLIASLAFRDDRLWQVLGCMGADGQPQIHLQAYTAMIDFGLDIQQAVDAPRWLSGRFGARRAPRPPEHGGPLPRGHLSRARAPRPRRQSLGGLERARRPRPRHHHRSRDRRARWAAPIRAATAPRSATDRAGCGLFSRRAAPVSARRSRGRAPGGSRRRPPRGCGR